MKAKDYLKLSDKRRKAYGFYVFRRFADAVKFADNNRDEIMMVVEIKKRFHVVPSVIAYILESAGYKIVY